MNRPRHRHSGRHEVPSGIHTFHIATRGRMAPARASRSQGDKYGFRDVWTLLAATPFPGWPHRSHSGRHCHMNRPRHRHSGRHEVPSGIHTFHIATRGRMDPARASRSQGDKYGFRDVWTLLALRVPRVTPHRSHSGRYCHMNRPRSRHSGRHEVPSGIHTFHIATRGRMAPARASRSQGDMRSLRDVWPLLAPRAPRVTGAVYGTYGPCSRLRAPRVTGAVYGTYGPCSRLALPG